MFKRNSKQQRTALIQSRCQNQHTQKLKLLLLPCSRYKRKFGCFEWKDRKSQQRKRNNQKRTLGSKCFCPPTFKCWNLIPNMVVLWGGPLGKWLAHKGSTLRMGLALLGKRPEGACWPTTHMRTHRMCHLCISGRFSPKLHLLVIWSWTSQTLELREINLSCLEIT